VGAGKTLFRAVVVSLFLCFFFVFVCCFFAPQGQKDLARRGEIGVQQASPKGAKGNGV
jgi:hypothetical protein